MNEFSGAEIEKEGRGGGAILILALPFRGSLPQGAEHKNLEDFKMNDHHGEVEIGLSKPTNTAGCDSGTSVKVRFVPVPMLGPCGWLCFWCASPPEGTGYFSLRFGSFLSQQAAGN